MWSPRGQTSNQRPLRSEEAGSTGLKKASRTQRRWTEQDSCSPAPRCAAQEHRSRRRRRSPGARASLPRPEVALLVVVASGRPLAATCGHRPIASAHPLPRAGRTHPHRRVSESCPPWPERVGHFPMAAEPAHIGSAHLLVVAGWLDHRAKASSPRSLRADPKVERPAARAVLCRTRGRGLYV